MGVIGVEDVMKDEVVVEELEVKQRLLQGDKWE